MFVEKIRGSRFDSEGVVDIGHWFFYKRLIPTGFYANVAMRKHLKPKIKARKFAIGTKMV